MKLLKKLLGTVDDVVCLVGVAVLAFGLHEIYAPVAWIAVGVLAVAWAIGRSDK